MTTSIKFEPYYNYSSSNYGVNSLVFTIGKLKIWYSYKTVVAFQDWLDDVMCRENEWSKTTEKHLNAIEPDKSKRVSGEHFEKQLKKILKKYDLAL